MKTVIVPICKDKSGDIRDAGNHTPASFATIISQLFEHYFYPTFRYFVLQLTIGLVLSQNMIAICVYKQKYPSVCRFFRCIQGRNEGGRGGTSPQAPNHYGGAKSMRGPE